MVEASAIERVEQCEATLDLVHFDHALGDVLDDDVLTLACQVVCDSEDGTAIVRQVAPFNNNKAVVDVISAGVGEMREDRGYSK